VCLLAEMGPDPIDDLPRLPDRLHCYVQEKQHRLQRAELLLFKALSDVESTALAAFTSCFDEDYHRYLLFEPLRSRWRAGVFTDRQWGGALRALLTAGHTTSPLVGIVGAEEVAGALREVGREALMLEAELRRLDGLEAQVVCYRGGWASTARDLATRGLSWSLSSSIAETFLKHNRSERRERQQGIILRQIVNRENIAAFFEEPEEEVIVYPSHDMCDDLTVMQCTPSDD
jgi:hypothetical protein